MQQQERGVRGVTADEVFIGNGVSELIDLTLRALLAADDEVLVPSPDYPLWTAAVNLNRGKAVHYPAGPRTASCRTRNRSRLWSRRARAPSWSSTRTTPPARCTRARCWRRIAALAERHGLVLFCGRDLRSDDLRRRRVRADGDAGALTLCCTMSGLSKVYRACGYRVGWAVVSGELANSRNTSAGLELLSSLRLCSNVPGQWAVQTALGGYQSIRELVGTGRRLYESRKAIVDGRRAQPLPHAAAAARRDVRVRRRGHRVGCRSSTTSSSQSTCSNTSTC
jgi:alanine-synthesizing transaminase